MSDNIDYGNLMHDAMRDLIRRVLEGVASNGLPGEHHFFINFDTHHSGVELADWMRDRFPDDMTIVLQHWFENLSVDENGFGVTLNFGDAPETLYVPYDAINTFVDPSVEFGLRFEMEDAHHPDLHLAGDDADVPEEAGPVEDPEHKKPKSDKGSDDDKADEDSHKDAEIVSLDSFRK
ncbi:ClpXP protease specificity-enhancing factor SspB [uncultured Aliiroseovarius sp.]|uniref:SspB family protein n=1 Tax=uncultured Aliiroseovarius sp. TaxID=1658783 RepID=UPI00259ABF30|nr:ClpXP protease specificity-enhancing factor SspB [uncultured Aliiroseovarius sp.]